MKYHKASFAILCIILFSNFLKAQEPLTEKDSIVVSSWIFQIGYTFVDDSGDAFNDFTTIKNQWNAVPYPSRLSLGRYFENGLGLEVIGSYTQYNEGNTVELEVLPESRPYYSLDSRLNYDLNKIIGQTGFFDPYVGVGLGYTYANELGRATYNANLGFRIWLSDHWGLDLSTTGKWAFNVGKENITNHIQHAAGVAYQFDVEKKLSKKGLQKKQILDEIAAEQQRVQDSIVAAQEAERLAREQAEALALQREKEAREKAEREAREKRNTLLQEINNAGKAYFALNSSYLNEDGKAVLDKLKEVMNSYPEIRIQIKAHADSRGTAEYNVWLTERRAQRMIDYLLAEGVMEDRLELRGAGESELLNECSDGVRCTEAQHRVNRRSEFVLME